MSVAITVQNLCKSFDSTEVFHDFSIAIAQGGVTALFGPNGSGKTTLLNILAGIVHEDSGVVTVKPFDRFQTSYIFQNYRESLLPWRTNFENLALPLEIQGLAPQVVRERIAIIREIFDLDCAWDRYPYEQSGGQQQILAFMRALVTQPKVLFIDEAFSALDYENTLRLREHLQTYYVRFKPTIVLVTHDIEEAVHIADRIVVLSRKPTRVIGEVQNSAAYPRDVDSIRSKAFNDTRDAVLSLFQKATNL